MTNSNNRFVRYHELKDYGVSYSRQHLAYLEARGYFPMRVRLSSNRIAWRLSEIEDWMDARTQEREQGTDGRGESPEE